VKEELGGLCEIAISEAVFSQEFSSVREAVKKKVSCKSAAAKGRLYV
jgi:hypothetical protein